MVSIQKKSLFNDETLKNLVYKRRKDELLAENRDLVFDGVKCPEDLNLWMTGFLSLNIVNYYGPIPAIPHIHIISCDELSLKVLEQSFPNQIMDRESGIVRIYCAPSDKIPLGISLFNVTKISGSYQLEYPVTIQDTHNIPDYQYYYDYLSHNPHYLGFSNIAQLLEDEFDQKKWLEKIRRQRAQLPSNTPLSQRIVDPRKDTDELCVTAVLDVTKTYIILVQEKKYSGDPGLYGLPKGIAKINESAKECVYRVLSEKLGINFRHIKHKFLFSGFLNILQLEVETNDIYISAGPEINSAIWVTCKWMIRESEIRPGRFNAISKSMLQELNQRYLSNW